MPGASLFVPGAVEDTRRAVEWLYTNLDLITGLHFSMDTHRVFQIFHPAWWIDDRGQAPTAVHADHLGGRAPRRWQPIAHPAECLEYTKQLETTRKYVLTVWPYHTLLGGVSHALVPAMMEAAIFHSVRPQSSDALRDQGHARDDRELLGPLARRCRELGGQSVGAFNAPFFKMLMEYDRIYVFGQAKSHCVLSTLVDLRDRIQSDRSRRWSTRSTSSRTR